MFVYFFNIRVFVYTVRILAFSCKLSICPLSDVPCVYSVYPLFTDYLLKIIQVLSDLVMTLLSNTLVYLNNLKVVLSLMFVCNIRFN